MRKMKVLVFALLMARPTHGSDDHAEIVVPFSEDVKTVSSISTVTLKTLTLTGGDNSNKGCLSSPMNNFMSSRKFRRPSRIFRWHSP